MRREQLCASFWSVKETINKAAEILTNYKTYLKEYEFIYLNQNMRDLLDCGLVYTHGRDRSLRPITISSPQTIIGKTDMYDDAITVCHFVNKYI